MRTWADRASRELLNSSLRAVLNAPGAVLSVASPTMASAPADLNLQVQRLDVESGDILVVRTQSRLTSARAAEIHDTVAALASRHGVRDVTVMVLDNCTDLTVERPGPSRRPTTPESTPQNLTGRNAASRAD